MSWNEDNREFNHNQNSRFSQMPSREPRYEQPQVIEDIEPTIISKGTKITGTIEVPGDLIVQGEVEGDITCHSRLSVNGVVDGSINTADLDLHDAIIEGDVVCNGNFRLSETASVNGDCKATNLVCGGRIRGNVEVIESAAFEEKAALVGDLSAGDIEIQKGAVLQGKVDIRQDVYFDSDKN